MYSIVQCVAGILYICVLLSSCDKAYDQITEVNQNMKSLTVNSLKEIFFAGGCFWGTEKVFKAVPGVTDTEVGYANGSTYDPTYQQVCTDLTGHRETVRVIYDENMVSLEDLVHVFFIVIDPTVKDMQGADRGTQYQTGVYYSDNADLPVIEMLFEAEKEKYCKFFVELKPLECFWPAEEYHQDYLDKNPGGYCHITSDEMREVQNYFQKDNPQNVH